MAILSLIGLALGVVVLGIVVALFNRVVEPALEIRSYADRTYEAAAGIQRNLSGLEELERTRALAHGLAGAAAPYVERLERGGR